MKTPLEIPLDQRNAFKRKYWRQLQWDTPKSLWCWNGDYELPEDLQGFVPAPRLTIELVPRTCWLSNVRNHVEKSQWDFIRKSVYLKASNKCEICGGKGPKWPVECHEIFEF